MIKGRRLARTPEPNVAEGVQRPIAPAHGKHPGERAVEEVASTDQRARAQDGTRTRQAVIVTCPAKQLTNARRA
jgi:hypothetical protein